MQTALIDVTMLGDAMKREVVAVASTPEIKRWAQARKERFLDMLTTLTPLQRRICTALALHVRGRMSYAELAEALWPPGQHPRAWRYSSNGGPPGCYMALSRAIGQLVRRAIVFDAWKAPGDRTVGLC
jgi:hypothetical protein